VTHRSGTRGKSIWARATVWLAAYALVLQTVLAPIAASAAANTAATDAALLVLCAEHTGTVGQTQPVAPHDHEHLCKFCIGCAANALLTPDTFATAGAGFAITQIGWHFVFHLGPDRDYLAGKQARGPPALT